MNRETARALKEGIGYGVVAGIIFGVAVMIVAVTMNESMWSPLRLMASVVMGKDALTDVSGAPVVTGIIVHLILSGVFGGIYGLFDAALSRELRASFAWQAGLGLVFGVALWLVDFQIIARVIYPWFLSSQQMTMALLHAVFFGLPLGLMIAGAERMAVAQPRPTPKHA